MSKLSLFLTVAASCLALIVATDPLTLTLGTTAYTLTSGQVALAAASVAALALTKELLIIADLSRRGRRDTNTVSQSPLNLAGFFDAIAQSDVADCGKLLVCHSMAKNAHALTSEEKLITKLFDDLEVIDPTSGYAEYQLAAYAGTFKQPELCVARYARCPVSPNQLGDLIKVQEPGRNSL